MADLQSLSIQPDSDSQPIFNKAHHCVTLKFKDVCYKIKLKKGGPSKEKQILKGITGMVQPGEMLAMLGPSGSGKTTLLTALGGRLGGDITGHITYNGRPFSNVMQRRTGFVTQDDVLYPHLTVTETLVFTALLRLPNTITKQEKIMHVENVISELGLVRCKNSVIGGSLLRGISGGERKRVSIGQELLINPSLLFLDEPTSGLDSTTAQRIVSTLWELAEGGRTVVMTIHQPSSRLFYMFHKVLLLSEGNPLYFGEGGTVMDYFSSIGYAPSVAMNPSDFLLDLANGILSDESDEDQSKVKQILVSAYKNNLDVKVKFEIEENGKRFQGKTEEKKFRRWPISWYQQFYVLLIRGLIERKNEAFSKLKIAEVLLTSLFCGLLWWKSDISHLQDQVGLLYFYSMFWGFYSLFQAIFTFPQERMMLEKERASGMYKLSSYFMARTIGDLPMELVLPTIFVTITYWMAGLKPTASNFVATLLVLLYNVLVAQGMGFAIGALVMHQKSAITLGAVMMQSYSLAGGYFVQHIPSFISWVKYLSYCSHSFKLLLGCQYKHDEKYPCGDGYCLVGDYPAIKLVGLDGQGMAIIAMAIMLVGYRLVAYFALMRFGKRK